MNEVKIDDMTVRIDTDRKSTQEIMRDFVATANEQVSQFVLFLYSLLLKTLPYKNFIQVI